MAPLITVDQARDGIAQFMHTPTFTRLVENPPFVFLGFFVISLIFGIVSPFFTLFCLQLHSWFKVEVDSAIRWFNFFYTLVWTIMIALLISELLKMKDLFM